MDKIEQARAKRAARRADIAAQVIDGMAAMNAVPSDDDVVAAVAALPCSQAVRISMAALIAKAMQIDSAERNEVAAKMGYDKTDAETFAESVAWAIEDVARHERNERLFAQALTEQRVRLA